MRRHLLARIRVHFISPRRPLAVCAVLFALAAATAAAAQSPPTQDWVLRFIAGFWQAVWTPAAEAPDAPPFTLEAWVFADSPAHGGLILGRTDTNAADTRYGLTVIDGFVQLMLFHPDGTSAAEASLPVGRWVHVAGVAEGTELRLYVDGALAATGIAGGIPVGSPTDRMHVGVNFPGAVARARVWSRALSQGDLDREVGGGDAGLFAAWPLDEGFFAQIAADVGTFGRHLTIGGTPEEDPGDAHWVPREAIEDGPYFRTRPILGPRPGDNTGWPIDFDDDGDVDYVRSGAVLLVSGVTLSDPPFWDASGPPPMPLSAYRNDGAGNLADATDEVFPEPVQLVAPRRHMAADFDGDGRDDLWFADHGPDGLPDPYPGQYSHPGAIQTLILQTPAGHLVSEPHRLPQVHIYMHHQAAGDIDGDGDVDIFSGFGTGDDPYASDGGRYKPSFWINDGLGFFTDDPSRVPQQLRTEGLVAALLVDVDGDADLDLFVGSGGDPVPPRDRLYINDGKGYFAAAAPAAIPVRPHATHSTLFAAAGDLDGDGHVDLALTAYDAYTYQQYSARLLLNNGDGTFRDGTAGLPADVAFIDGPGFDHVFAVDVNGDDHLDLVFSKGPLRPRIYVNRGGGRFERMPELLGIKSAGNLMPADFDGDGDLDFVTDGGEPFAVIETLRPWYGLDGVPPPAGAPMATPAIPGFRFYARITAGGSQISGTPSASCLPETLCIDGALAGRAEIFARVVGPKPNGYLWPTLVRFSTSAIEIWVEQQATGEVRYYTLPAAAPGHDRLNGYFDREGFLPHAGAPQLGGAEHPWLPGAATTADGVTFTSPAYPGYRFTARIANQSGEAQPVRVETECLAETVCLSGAVPGRSELFLRIVGPKPNGYLWPTLVKFSTSTVEIDVEQLATGVVRHYRLDGASPGTDSLPGLFDRTGFEP